MSELNPTYLFSLVHGWHKIIIYRHDIHVVGSIIFHALVIFDPREQPLIGDDTFGNKNQERNFDMSFS